MIVTAEVDPRVPRSARGTWRNLVRLSPLLASGGLILWYRNLGWLPNDDGTLLQGAQRVRIGQLPHIDFHTPYTGGLDFLNSWAIGLFGDRMSSLRSIFVPLVILWMYSMFSIAKRVLPGWLASLSVAALTLGSVFMHLSPVPSWHNLFLGTFALNLALRFLESEKLLWLIGSGVLLGVSVVLKTTGAYFLMAVGMLVIAAIGSRGDPSTRRLAKLMVSLPPIAVGLLVAADPTWSRIIGLIVPVMLASLIAVWGIDAVNSPVSAGRVSSLVVVMAVLLASFAIPVTAWTVWYWIQGGASDLLNAVLVVPRSYIDELTKDLAPLVLLGVPAVFGLLIMVLGGAVEKSGRKIGWVIGLAWLSGFWIWKGPTLLLGLSVLVFLPLTAGVVAVLAARTNPPNFQEGPDLARYGLLAGAASFALITFPAANQYYYSFVFPFAALATFGWLFRRRQDLAEMAVFVMVGMCVVFALGKLDGSWFADASTGESRPFEKPDIDRLDLSIPIHYRFYEPLIAEVQAVDKRGASVLAGPDSPEVYALAGISNPTPVLFELISSQIDPGFDAASVFVEYQPDVYVLNSEPANSVVSPNLIRLLDAQCVVGARYAQETVYVCSR